MKKFLCAMVFFIITLSACEASSPAPVVVEVLVSPTETIVPTPTWTPAPTPTLPPTLTPFPDTITDFAHGISLGSQGDDTTFNQHLGAELHFLSALNVDTIRINTQWFMPKPGSSEIRMLPEQGSLSDEGIRFFADSVYEAGMDSWLALHLYYDGWTGWAGGHQASDWDEWEKNYTNYVLHYARLSERLNIDYLSIMNELQTVVIREAFVTDLIQKVRSVYSGKIVVNIDSCPDNYHTLIPPAVVKASDVIGLQLYPGPQTSQNASIEEMTNALVPYFNKVADHFSALEYKSLIISEFGITRLDGATSKKCTWIWPETKKEDLKEMADYYQAFANALDQSRLRPMLDGVVLHEWKINEKILEGGLLDNGAWGEFVPRGNQMALDVITRWYLTLDDEP